MSYGQNLLLLQTNDLAISRVGCLSEGLLRMNTSHITMVQIWTWWKATLVGWKYAFACFGIHIIQLLPHMSRDEDVKIDDEDDGESEGDESCKCQNCDLTLPLSEVEEKSAWLRCLIQLGGPVAEPALSPPQGRTGVHTLGDGGEQAFPRQYINTNSDRIQAFSFAQCISWSYLFYFSKRYPRSLQSSSRS